MAKKTGWAWLGEPVAHDFANTIHWRGVTQVDHIADADGLRDWLAHEPHLLPPVTDLTPQVVAEVRQLRDAVRAAMTAVANGADVAECDLVMINGTAREHPTIQVLADGGRTMMLEPARRDVQPLLGVLAQEAVAVLGDPDRRSRIAFCAAPGCGSLFERHRRNQVWCDPHCGARARAERHYQATLT